MLTLSLGQFVEHLSANNIPKEAMSIARRGFIDTIGTMIAGRYEETPQILRNTLKPPNGEATLYFSDQHAQAPEAAWINGTAAHVLDYDDEALCGHPSAVLVPAILAEAEALDSPGIDMLVAYIGGYETWPNCVIASRAFITRKAGIRRRSTARWLPRPPAAS